MRFLVAFASLLIAYGAEACPRWVGEARIANLLNTEVVVLAEIVSYEPKGKIGTNFRIRPREVWKGDISDRLDDEGTMTVTWSNRTFPVPERSLHDTLIFGLTKPAFFEVRDKRKFVYVTHPDYMTVIVRSCGGTHIYIPSGGLDARLASLFDGKGNAAAEAETLQQDTICRFTRLR